MRHFDFACDEVAEFARGAAVGGEASRCAFPDADIGYGDIGYGDSALNFASYGDSALNFAPFLLEMPL